jgi:hypothetical protein
VCVKDAAVSAHVDNSASIYFVLLRALEVYNIWKEEDLDCITRFIGIYGIYNRTTLRLGNRKTSHRLGGLNAKEEG